MSHALDAMGRPSTASVPYLHSQYNVGATLVGVFRQAAFGIWGWFPSDLLSLCCPRSRPQPGCSSVHACYLCSGSQRLWLWLQAERLLHLSRLLSLMRLLSAQSVAESATANPTAAALVVPGRACVAREASTHTMMGTKRATGTLPRQSLQQMARNYQSVQQDGA